MIKMANRKGQQGIGTLIIFIALILVAAVAAGVLIQTASSLQSKSLNVGRQSQEKLTSDIDVVQVYVENTSDHQINANTDNFTVVVRLGSGSNPIKLADTLLKLDTQSGSQTLTYVSGSTFSTKDYTVYYIINGSNHKDGYLTVGDLAKFQFTAGNTIKEGETITLRIVSKNGAVKPIAMTTPSAMTETITYLYP